MKLLSVLTEMRYGRVGPSVSTIDRSSPWYKKAVSKKNLRNNKIVNAPTDKLKFDTALSYKEKVDSVKVTVNGSQTIVSYDRTSGQLIMSNETGVWGRKEIKAEVYDTNEITYINRTTTNGGKTYYYNFEAPVKKNIRMPNPTYSAERMDLANQRRRATELKNAEEWESRSKSYSFKPEDYPDE